MLLANSYDFTSSLHLHGSSLDFCGLEPASLVSSSSLKNHWLAGDSKPPLGVRLNGMCVASDWKIMDGWTSETDARDTKCWYGKLVNSQKHPSSASVAEGKAQCQRPALTSAEPILTLLVHSSVFGQGPGKVRRRLLWPVSQLWYVLLSECLKTNRVYPELPRSELKWFSER